MACYDRSSIVALSTIVIGIADVVTFLSAASAPAVFAVIVYSQGTFHNAESYGRELAGAAEAAWPLLAAATAVSGGLGYLLTLVLRVAGQMMLAVTAIEENTRGKTAA